MGHKSNADWSDVTSLGRNDIVFEGRNKAYGAYYVRQQYDRALLLGLLFSLSFIVIGVGVPTLINKLMHHQLPAIAKKFEPGERVVKQFFDFPTVQPKKLPPPPTHNKQPATQNTIPVVVQHTDKPDSSKTQHDLQTLVVGTTTTPGPQTTDPGPQPAPDPNPTGTASTEIFKIVQHMPQFPGDMGEFISNHVEFPAQYREMGIQGTVYATFVVEADGSISGVHILQGINGAELLNTNTVKGLQQMPNWTPGSQNGHPVRVQYTLPVRFELH